MKNSVLLSVCLLALLGWSRVTNATTRIVDMNGGGQFTSIQAGIDAAEEGDTVVVWPGSYFEQVNLNKSILLQGSGYENTLITGSYDPVVTISNSAKMKWFCISSLVSTGVYFSGTGSIITNCLIKSCPGIGIYCPGGSNGYVYNSIITDNGSNGILVAYVNGGAWLTVINCISVNNNGYGYFASGDWWNGGANINLCYSNGSIGASSGAISGQQGIIDTDPGFAFPEANDYHITQASPCWNTGQPLLTDPDGSRSDMGYFGGPDAPIYPVVYEMTTAPNGSNINVNAKARANY